MSDTPINRMGEVYIESAWRMAVGVCIQPTCCTDGITPTGEQCRRAFVSRERFDEHIAPLLHDLAKAQADLTAANARIKELEKDAARLSWLEDADKCYLVCVESQPHADTIFDGPGPGLRAAIDKARES